jgi:Trk-type K+ transport system membrane component
VHSAPEKIPHEQEKENQQTIQQHQITFTPETNILREKERQKLKKLRDNSDPIMTAPTDKKDLTRNERYRIGGTEYRALNLLARLVPIYYLGFLIGFALFMRIYIACSTYAQEVLDTIDPWFFSIFVSVTAFTNLGLCHLDSSFALFRNSPVPLFLVMILVLVGNTAYAILLRCIIWICFHLTPAKCVMQREAFRYLLDHPRRCYTTLFPATQTWWLLIILVAITVVEWTSFVALNYWLPVLNGIPWASRCLGGLFQAVSTRNGNVLINKKR